jgi:hypothetical protein
MRPPNRAWRSVSLQKKMQPISFRLVHSECTVGPPPGWCGKDREAHEMRVSPTTAVAARITTIMGTMVTNLLPDIVYLHRAATCERMAAFRTWQVPNAKAATHRTEQQ